jgi:hypothetical protein
VFADVDEKTIAAGPHHLHAVVCMAVTIHPLRQAVGAQYVDCGLLEHARSNAGQHVRTAVFFQHHARHAVPMEDLRQQQARRAAADDGHLSPHPSFHAALQINIVTV